jgi:ABC-type multidrug transport system ATPase subunit
LDKTTATEFVNILVDLAQNEWDIEQCEYVISAILDESSSVNYEDLLTVFHSKLKSDKEKTCKNLTLEQRIEIATLFYKAIKRLKLDDSNVVQIWNALGVTIDEAVCLYQLLTFELSAKVDIAELIAEQSNKFDKSISENNCRIIYIESPKAGAKNNIINDSYFKQGFEGQLALVFFPKIASYLCRYVGPNNLLVDDESVLPNSCFFFRPGSSITTKNNITFRYDDINRIRLKIGGIQPLQLAVDELEFSFPDSNQGIKKFSTVEESGRIVGILGGSGVGKSTLLNLLAGKLNPQNGRVLINGYDVHKEQVDLMGVIGFVPQDDLLIENLTVYQNMYYNARLCFGNYTKQRVRELVEYTLKSLDLWEARDLRVGSTLDKVISGGQRKRLNIGLELLREPALLFLDEPTSGLSSSDSAMVMSLLRQLADSGKLIVVNIHQPSERLFRMFDRLWVLDKGGYPVFVGFPEDAVKYFKEKSAKTGNYLASNLPKHRYNPEDILDILEQREVDSDGSYTAKRVVAPEKWYRYYCEDIKPLYQTEKQKNPLPRSKFRLPDVVKQLKVFSIRNFLSKLSNKPYIILNILEPILLGLILSFFIRYSPGSEYVFEANKNLPAYIFMSVIVSLFLGLSVSAEEIIGDRKILERESFLNLSRFSYINSKVLYLFALSAIQTILFLAVSLSIIGIYGLTFKYWVVLFSSACFANMLGLVISAIMRSVVAIYITIPLLLVPQILLSGTVVDFDNLNSALTRRIYVPVIGDMMTSRWAYEALAVTQFMDNRYERNFFDAEMQVSQSAFKASLLIPRLQVKLDECIRLSSLSDSNRNDIARHLKFIANELEILEKRDNIPQFELIKDLKIGNLNNQVASELSGYLLYIKKVFQQNLQKATEKRDSIYESLKEELGEKGIYKLKQNYHNKALSDWVLRNNEVAKYLETDERLIQKAEPIFMLPDHPFGRSHFYAPYKYFNGQYVKTIWFNVIAIWLFTIFLYTILNLFILNKKTGKAPVLKNAIMKFIQR